MRARPRTARRPSVAALAPIVVALAASAPAGAARADDGERAAVDPARGAPAPAGPILGPRDGPEALDLTPDAALDARTLDARGRDLPTTPFASEVVAREVLAGLLAWEEGRGIGDGAFARPALSGSGAGRFAAVSPAGAEPALGAALLVGEGDAIERYRHDALDLSLAGPPALPEDVTIDEVPGLSFERRTVYQATTGRLFVDFRLRHRDPVHGTAALEEEARTAEAIARMRSLSTLVLEPERTGFGDVD